MPKISLLTTVISWTPQAFWGSKAGRRTAEVEEFMLANLVSSDLKKGSVTRSERSRTIGGHLHDRTQLSLPVVHRTFANTSPSALLSFAARFRGCLVQLRATSDIMCKVESPLVYVTLSYPLIMIECSAIHQNCLTDHPS